MLAEDPSAVRHDARGVIRIAECVASQFSL
jgi:hypothetical protein